MMLLHQLLCCCCHQCHWCLCCSMWMLFLNYQITVHNGQQSCYNVMGVLPSQASEAGSALVALGNAGAGSAGDRDAWQHTGRDGRLAGPAIAPTAGRSEDRGRAMVGDPCRRCVHPRHPRHCCIRNPPHGKRRLFSAGDGRPVRPGFRQDSRRLSLCITADPAAAASLQPVVYGPVLIGVLLEPPAPVQHHDAPHPVSQNPDDQRPDRRQQQDQPQRIGEEPRQDQQHRRHPHQRPLRER